MHNRPQHNDEAGSSLVEVMFATVLVVMFVGSLLLVSIQQGTHRRVNLETSLAMSAILDNLERIRAVPFSSLLGLDGSGFDIPAVNGSSSGGLEPLAGDLDGLPGEFTVSVAPQSVPGVTLYRVVATVEWRGASRARSLSMETLVGERK